MIKSAALFWLAGFVVAAPAPALASPETSPNKCVSTGSEPRDAFDLRPLPTVHCPYDNMEMQRRLVTLITDINAPLSVDRLEEVFSLPQQTTSYDSVRSADYSIVLRGEGGWQLRIWTRESAFPLNNTQDPAFTAGLRPTRLHKLSDLTVRHNITITPAAADSESLACLTNAKAMEAARAARMTERREELISRTHASYTYPYFETEEGRFFHVEINAPYTGPNDAALSQTCATSLILEQKPTTKRPE